MKKLVLIATCAAAVSASALPTYEPFTEAAFVNAIAASGSNAVDLATGGFTAPSGESWGNLSWSGTFGTNIKGLDILVTNYPGLFTYTAVSPLLPANFPGMPASGQSINYMLMNPAQPLVAGAASANIIGNSTVLIFNRDITRPTSGTNTLYVSYLWSLAQQGQLGGGNDARYLAFVAQSNTVEGKSVGYYNTWTSMLDTLPGSCNHAAHAVLGTSNPYNVACDNLKGQEFTSTPFQTGGYGKVQFIVGAITLTANGTYTNTMWVNPSTSAFGGPTPPASPIFNDAVTSSSLQLSDIGGLVVEDRPGHGANAGGLGSNYMANLLIGTTWSYVTGGPEFTTQPVASTITTPGSTATLTGVAVAASQNVSYQWQNNGVNISNGAGGAGGLATVSGATNSTLTLTGVSAGDSGTYTLVATASGTSYNLASSGSVLTVTDPGILTQPQPANVNYKGVATFTVSAVTATPSLSYAWYNGSTILVNGLQADGSTVSGAQGICTGGPLTTNLTLTISNATCAMDGSYSLWVTNNASSTANSTAAALTVNDPYIVVQPPSVAETVQGGNATISLTAAGTGISYQWYGPGGQLGNANEYSGVTSSTLSITGAQLSDVGSYYCVVSGTGCGTNVTSSATPFYVDTAATGIAMTPSTLTQQVGTHLAFVETVTGGSGFIHLVVRHNGTNLNYGQQADGSFVLSPSPTLSGPGTGYLILSNLQVADTGTYTVLASNAAGYVSAASTITVVPKGQLSLSTNNLIVSRVGEGSQPLSGATGNTLYLDQFTTNGTYVSTIMAPDAGTGAIVVAGAAIVAGNEGSQEAYLTTSSNQQFINFGGFCQSYPYTGGADVTVGSVNNVRGIYALNGAGIMALVYTNYGLYSGGHGFRDVYSTDGLTNFWTTGSASGGTVKYVNAGPQGASYTITTPGQGIPALSAANAGGICLGLIGPNLAFADNQTEGDAPTLNVYGINTFTGAPTATTTNSTEILPGGVYHADDFAVSPDRLTLYLADDDVSVNSGGNGGIQRWDYYSGVWNYSYNLSDNTGSGTNGTRGLVVYWPPSVSSWGLGANGAVIYATTSETVTNRIIEFVDNGSGSSATTLATAGPNEFYRGIRFGPIQVPLGVTASASSHSALVGETVDLSAAVSGSFTYYFPNSAGTGYNVVSVPPSTFQWYQNGVAVAGQTNFLLSLTNVQTSNAGSYSFVLTTGSTTVSNPPIVLNVNPFTTNANLVGWWRFNDGAGTNAADSSGYGDTASLQNFPNDNSEWVAGLGGDDALYYGNVDTNADNVVVAPDAPQLAFTNNLQFTLACWIKDAPVPETNAAGLDAGLITKGYGNGGEQFDLDIYAGYLRFFVRNASAGVTAINSTSYPTNIWEHVAATYDGIGGTMVLYTNGQVAGTATAPPSLLYTTNPVTIGNRTSSSTNGYNLPYYGEMQDVRIYNATLSQQDISTLYADLVPPSAPPSFSTNVPGSFIAPGQFQLTLSGSPGAQFRLWTTPTTNAFTAALASPTGTAGLTSVTNMWTLVTNGSFNGSGTAVITDLHATNTSQVYMMTQP